MICSAAVSVVGEVGASDYITAGDLGGDPGSDSAVGYAVDNDYYDA